MSGLQCAAVKNGGGALNKQVNNHAAKKLHNGEDNEVLSRV
jgi:hypothetical protein